LKVIHLRFVLGKKVKILVQHHAERPVGFIRKNLLKLSSFHVDGYLFTSKKIAIKLGIGEKKVFEMMEASSEIEKIDSIFARRVLNVQGDKTVYLWVGRLIDIKNPLFFLENFNKFSRNHAKVQLYILFQDDYLIKECREITVNNPNITFVGQVKHSSMHLWYGCADFFVSASVYEGSGYALCEAMSATLIPIIPSIDAFDFMTNNGECAISYQNNIGYSLLKALENSLLIDRAVMKSKIKKQYSAKLSSKAVSERFYEVVTNLKNL